MIQIRGMIKAANAIGEKIPPRMIAAVNNRAKQKEPKFIHWDVVPFQRGVSISSVMAGS